MIIGSERLFQIFKSEYPTKKNVFYSATQTITDKKKYSVIIYEDIKLNWSNIHVNLKPMGLLLCTYRCNSNFENIDVLKECLSLDVIPLDYRECDPLPWDLKFNFEKCTRLLKYDCHHIVWTSLGLAFYNPLKVEQCYNKNYEINKLWGKDERIYEYTDNNEKVNSIGLTEENNFRIFEFPKQLIKKNFSFNNFMNIFGINENDGCYLINELISQGIVKVIKE